MSQEGQFVIVRQEPAPNQVAAQILANNIGVPQIGAQSDAVNQAQAQAPQHQAQENLAQPPAAPPAQPEPVSAQVISQIVNQAISGVTSYIDNAIIPLKSASKEVEELKLQSKLNFNHRGNKTQFQFNHEILSNVEASISRIEEGNITEVLPLLKESAEKLSKRNKLIRLADKSDGGWAVVDEYLSDDLAEDSDDDRRIRSAQAKASRKKRARAASRQQKPYQRKMQYGQAYGNPSGANFRRQNYGYGQYQFGNSQKGGDRCFACGERGHWRRQCTAASQSATKGYGAASTSNMPKEGARWY
ncbi:uncharacterized protein [Amphiura filiformis]|uniref:uncharacterized protein n=1 Tax=Amphiura filiformis TaxID=82378 RepID=UPI003B20CDB2